MFLHVLEAVDNRARAHAALHQLLTQYGWALFAAGLKLGGLERLESFLDLLARYAKIGGSLVEVALRAGEGQALADELLAGGGEMGVGFRSRRQAPNTCLCRPSEPLPRQPDGT